MTLTGPHKLPFLYGILNHVLSFPKRNTTPPVFRVEIQMLLLS